jgi:predicted small integral membrane protein
MKMNWSSKLAFQLLIIFFMSTGIATWASAQDTSQPAADNTQINASRW